MPLAIIVVPASLVVGIGNVLMVGLQIINIHALSQAHIAAFTGAPSLGRPVEGIVREHFFAKLKTRRHVSPPLVLPYKALTNHINAGVIYDFIVFQTSV
jgi:hypothetical protein